MFHARKNSHVKFSKLHVEAFTFSNAMVVKEYMNEFYGRTS